MAQNQELIKILQTKEDELIALKTEFLTAHQANNGCETDCFVGKDVDSCRSLNGMVDNTSGLKGDYSTPCQGCQTKVREEKSTIQLAGGAKNPLDPVQMNDVCISEQLDQHWSSNFDFEGTSKWAYVGTPSGTYRIFPGVSKNDCVSYDPRTRPWYIAATAGPKDVVIVADVSGSMLQPAENPRIELLKKALKEVLNTMTANDFFAIVTFSNDARVLGGHNGLIQGTAENVAAMVESINAMTVESSTDFGKGMAKALELFTADDSTIDNPTSAECTKAILFMSDGEPNDSQSFNNALDDLKTLKVDHQVHTFTFALGVQNLDPEADAVQLTKQLACDTQGIFIAIDDDGEELTTQMQSYFNYFTLLRSEFNTIAWTEPYEDAAGAGLVTTAAISVFDENQVPPAFLGVVGIDLTVEDMLAVSDSASSLLKSLVYRSKTCNDIAAIGDECTLEYYRKSKTYLVNPISNVEFRSECKAVSDTTCDDPDLITSKQGQYCKSKAVDSNSDYDTLRVTNNNYANDVCGSTCLHTGIIGWIILGVVLGIVVVCGVGFLILKKKKIASGGATKPAAVINNNGGYGAPQGASAPPGAASAPAPGAPPVAVY